MKLNHLHIAVPDVKMAQKFYEDFFDMTLAFNHGNGVFLKDTTGFLLAIDPILEGTTVNLPSWYHHGFCLDNAEQVKTIYLKMKAAGVEMSRDYQEFGDSAANFYCWSPGPIQCEVSWNRDDESSTSD
jgi:catechol 2,3-dioxygenase-like lactoylglutathione lyase family enzyme